MSPRRGDQRGEAVEQLERGEHQRRLATGRSLGSVVANLLIAARKVATTVREWLIAS
jgi:hypothetical protein